MANNANCRVITQGLNICLQRPTLRAAQIIAWLSMLLLTIGAFASAAATAADVGNPVINEPTDGSGERAIGAPLNLQQSRASTRNNGTPTAADISYKRIRRVSTAAPTAITGSATGITPEEVTLNGTINDNGADTTVTFEYGSYSDYGYIVSATTGGTVTAGSGATAVSVTITGFNCHDNRYYHFRVNGENSIGITNGDDATFAVSLCPQTIYFNNPGPQLFGTAPRLIALTNAAAQVTFTSSTPSVCTITTDGYLTFITAGTCTINADQPGDTSEYAAAPTVTQSFMVVAVVPGAPTMVSGFGGNTQAALSWNAPASNGGVAITGYSVTQSIDGMSYSAVSAGTCTSAAASTATTCLVSGLTNGMAYTFKVAAINSVGTGAASTASANITPTPPNLTITTAHIGNVMLGTAGGAYTLTVTNSGGFTDGTAVTVTDTLPAGLTATAMSGTGWTCDFATTPSAPFCTRSDVLLGGASYPAITLIVNIAGSAPDAITDQVTNSASVSGGGDGTLSSNADATVVHVYVNGFEGS